MWRTSLLLLALLAGWRAPAQADSLRALFDDPGTPDSVRFERGLDLLILLFRSDLDSARSVGHELLAFATEKKRGTWEATAERAIGNTYAVQGDFHTALEHFLRSHAVLEELGDEPGLAVSANNIGTVYYEQGAYIRAQQYLLQSLGMAEELQDSVGAARALNNLGNVHNDMGNESTALDYYQRSLALREALGQKAEMTMAWNNIGLVLADLGRRQEALEALNRSADIAREMDDPRAESRALSNIGWQYSLAGDLEQAQEYFDRCIAIMTAVGDPDGLVSAHLFRGQNHLLAGRPRQALADCRISLEGSEASGALNVEKESCRCLGDAHEALGDARTALAYTKRYQVLKDSLFNKERTQEITRADMNYAFEKEQLADSIAFHKQRTEQEVAHQQQLNAEHRRFFVTLLIGLLIIAGLGFLYWKHRQDLKVKVLENQVLNSEIEYKRRDLTTMAVNISNNQEWAESLAGRLETLKASTGRQRAQELEELEAQIKSKVRVDKESEEFHQRIDELSSAFYDHLTSRFEGLTKNDIRLCSLIKLDLNTKQIAALQNINPASVKMSRNRLRKKLGLAPEDDLNAFLRTF